MWDYQTHSAGRVHPIFLIRRGLNEREIRPIETCYRIGRTVRPVWGTPPPIITVAGLMILRQKPPTAKGVFFLTLKDETGVIQCVVRPEVLEALDAVLRSSVLIVAGELGIVGNWRGLVVRNAWRLDGMFGGYEGHPNHVGGRDRWVREVGDLVSSGEGHVWEVGSLGLRVKGLPAVDGERGKEGDGVIGIQ